jgi:hypothetical protein
MPGVAAPRLDFLRPDISRRRKYAAAAEIIEHPAAFHRFQTRILIRW